MNLMCENVDLYSYIIYDTFEMLNRSNGLE